LLFRGGFFLALREPAQLRQDTLHTTTGRVMATIEVPRVLASQLNQTAFPLLNVLGELADLFVERQ
jgi:hypothetical protein